MDLAVLVHAIAAIRSSALGRGIDDSTQISRCTNYDDDEDAFEILEALGIITQPALQPDPEFLIYDVVINRPSLREHLADFPPPLSMEKQIIGCFVRMASAPAYEQRFLYDPDLLPIEAAPTPFPKRFLAEVSALRSGGYCLVADETILWTKAAIAIFHDKGIWIDGQPAIEKEIAELVEFWLTMPEAVKVHCVRGGELNSLMLAATMRDHWDAQSGWDENVREGRRWPLNAISIATGLGTMMKAARGSDNRVRRSIRKSLGGRREQNLPVLP